MKLKTKIDDDKTIILRGVKLRLFTTKEDEDCIREMFRLRDLVYNWAIARLWENYNSYQDDMENYRILRYEELSNMFTIYRNSKDCDPDIKIFHIGPSRVAIRDAMSSFMRLKNQIPKGRMKPRFHSTNEQKAGWRLRNVGLRGDKSYIKDGMLHTENVGTLPRLTIDVVTHDYDLCGGNGMKGHQFITPWYKPRICEETDGLYLTFSIPRERKSLEDKPWTEPIGIDLGCKKTFQLSTEEVFNQPDVSRLNKKISDCNKKIYRLYKLRKKRAQKQGLHVWELPKSQTEQALIDAKHKAYKTIHNRIEYFYYQVVNDIVQRRPKAIVLETIYVKRLMHISETTDLRRTIAQVYFCMIRYMFESKCEEYGVPLYELDPQYPSSLLCNRCKYKNDGLGSKRIFVCPNCGYTVDRDLNASLNIRDVYVNKEKDNINWWNGLGTELIVMDKLTHR